MKTLRFQLLLWGLTLALVPTLFFAVWFWRYGLFQPSDASAFLDISVIAVSAAGVVVFLLALIYWGYQWIVTPIRQLTVWPKRFAKAILIIKWRRGCCSAARWK